MDMQEAAKTVFISYRQLEKLLEVLDKHGEKIKEGYSLPNNLAAYNAILQALREAFAIDPSFLNGIEHLKLLEDEGGAFYQMKTDGAVLLGTAKGFIEMYMGEEGKRKIGFV